jgi:uncharacterized membrane protein YagU involved in acid resistance
MTTGRWLWLGFWGGMLGGVLMAVVEMTSHLLAGHSLFTPMHMIAAPVVGDGPMMAAMKGGPLYVEAIPALLGMVGHFLWAGVIWGFGFGLIAAWGRLVGQVALGWGLVYGVAVGLFMSAVVLPIFGFKPLWEAGWIPFTLMHLGYGLGPGLAVWRGAIAIPVAATVTRRAA